MMVGRDVQLQVDKKPADPGRVVLDVENVTMHSAQHKKDAVRDVSFQVHAGEIVCLAGIEGNGQTEFVYGLTGLEKISSGKITLDGKDITNESIRQRSKDGMSHIPEDRHKHGLVLDYSLENNMVLQRYWQPEFQKGGFIRSDKVREYSDKLIAQYDVRSGQGSLTTVRSMSGGNQQKAIIAREIDKDPKLLVAVQPLAVWTLVQLNTSTVRSWPSAIRYGCAAGQSGAGRGDEPVRPHPCDVRGRGRGRI